MWNFIRRMMYRPDEDELSILAKQAADLQMTNFRTDSFRALDSFSAFSLTNGDYDHQAVDELEQQQLESFAMQQIIHDMHDPYATPGIDSVVDETYHGIDHHVPDYGVDDHSYGANDGF